MCVRTFGLVWITDTIKGEKTQFHVAKKKDIKDLCGSYEQFVQQMDFINLVAIFENFKRIKRLRNTAAIKQFSTNFIFTTAPKFILSNMTSPQNKDFVTILDGAFA